MRILIHNADKTFLVLPDSGSIVYDMAQFELVELEDIDALTTYIIDHQLIVPPAPEFEEVENDN